MSHTLRHTYLCYHKKADAAPLGRYMAWAMQSFPTVTERFLREAGMEDPMRRSHKYSGACSDPKSLEGGFYDQTFYFRHLNTGILFNYYNT